MNIVNVKGRLRDARVLSVVSYSRYMPTKEKPTELADNYESNADIFAFACNNNGFVSGIIILKRLGCGECEIVSIATDPACRNRAIASKLVSFAANALKCNVIKAQTDDDTVGF